jgi:metallopeptidase MepB
MEIYEHIFDIKFQQITGQHVEGILGSDTEYLKVHTDCLWESQSNAFIGYIYFDFFPRDGKYTHRDRYILQPV